MKALISFIVLALFIQDALYSQPCLSQGITFSSQEDIDNFQTNHPNCTEIEGDVDIDGNDIVNLFGLNVVTTIGGDLRVWYNDILISLSGLENLTSIGGSLEIYYNNSLTSLTGLDNLTSIGQDLHIGESEFDDGNPLLTDIQALGNLTSIGGVLEISNNPLLTNLAGLDNVDASSITELYVFNNSSLPDCDVQSVCEYLASPTGSVNIYNNAAGCNNPVEVTNDCGLQFECLPYGNYWFVTQDEVDNYQANYSGCYDLNGKVTITGGNGVINLNGLSVINSIEGGLFIWETDMLTDLSGLEGLSSVGGYLWIEGMNALTNLMGLENLTSIGGFLKIAINDSLISLSGLDNIEASSIESLDIYWNGSLTTCEVQSVCDYITSPGATVFINSNASGCNTQEEVEEGCEASGVPSYQNDLHINIHPNPSNDKITISSSYGVAINNVNIYNQIGQKVKVIEKVNGPIDVSMLPIGIYIIKLNVGDKLLHERFVIR